MELSLLAYFSCSLAFILRPSCLNGDRDGKMLRLCRAVEDDGDGRKPSCPLDVELSWMQTRR